MARRPNAGRQAERVNADLGRARRGRQIQRHELERRARDPKSRYDGRLDSTAQLSARR